MGSLIYSIFSAKRHESWTHVIYLLGFGLGFDHKETSQTHGNLSKVIAAVTRHSCTSCALFLQYDMGTENNYFIL
jgi:hypothetical protein